MRTKNPGGSGCDRSDQLLDADNVHEQSKIIHQNRERHLGRDQAMIMSLSRRRDTVGVFGWTAHYRNTNRGGIGSSYRIPRPK